MAPASLEHLPGGDLVEKGRRDLEGGRESIEALLVSIASPRLRAADLDVARVVPDAEHRLWKELAQADPASAHSRYNALLRRLTVSEGALECVPQPMPSDCDASWTSSAGRRTKRPRPTWPEASPRCCRGGTTALPTPRRDAGRAVDRFVRVSRLRSFWEVVKAMELVMGFAGDAGEGQADLTKAPESSTIPG